MRRRRTIVVDGYNFIGATLGLSRKWLRKGLMDPTGRLEKMRNSLADRLGAYAKIRGHDVYVVFDGAAMPVDYYPRQAGIGARVVFSGTEETADEWIVKFVRKHKGLCVVISDDREVKALCEEAGAIVLSCEAFEGFLVKAEEEAKEGKARPKDERAEEISEDDPWARFCAFVEPLKGGSQSRKSATEVDSDLLSAMLEVPEEVAQRRKEESLLQEKPQGEGRLDRRSRTLRNVLKDL